MKQNSNDHFLYSFAGKLGAASRWKHHVKIPSTLIRVNKNDADYLTNLAAVSSLSVAVLVSRLIQSLRANKISLVPS